MRKRIASTRARLAAFVGCVLVALGAMLALGAARAGGAEYTVLQCDAKNRGFEDARFERRNGGDYSFRKGCEEDELASALQVRNISRTPPGREGRISWAAPPQSRIVAVEVEARLRRDAGHAARLIVADDRGNENGLIAAGGRGPGGFESYDKSFRPGGRAQFAALLACVGADPCRRSDRARTWVRSVALTLRDAIAPRLAPTGTLLAGGWRRGRQSIGTTASDAGSGVRRIELLVNGEQLPASTNFDCATVSGSALASRLRPCAGSRSLTSSPATAAAPFRDGANRIALCARDFGRDGNRACRRTTVLVDNAPPAAAFADRQSRADPELIRVAVSDRHSGVSGGSIAYRPSGGGSWRVLPTRLAGGELRARVDSEAERPGRYRFRATVRDAAGNRTVTGTRRGGGAMVLAFPLKERTKLDARLAGGRRRATVGYGRRPLLAGVLRGRGGRPIAGEQVRVLERFARGSSMRPIARPARTDRQGRYSLRLGAGPSRRVLVSYPGSRRYSASSARPVRLTVRGRATLAISKRRVRAGRRVRFSGRVGSRGVAMPRGGKLVELEVSDGGRWRQVRGSFRTDRRGRWRTRYRFGRFYREPVSYRFRLVVPREARWPYRGPTRSKPRRLTVRPAAERR